jgi:hypothetical protein
MLRWEGSRIVLLLLPCCQIVALRRMLPQLLLIGCRVVLLLLPVEVTLHTGQAICVVGVKIPDTAWCC